MSTPSLYTLPIEVLHRIIDYVDIETNFLSFRIVCKRFYTIVNTYNQYELDFRSITRLALHHMRYIVNPENVISLILSDEHKTSGQINLFISLFNIHTFTRLRSLTLIRVQDPDLTIFLEHIITCSLLSLSINLSAEKKSTVAMDLLPSTITKLTSLQKLDITKSPTALRQIQLPLQCSARNLTFSGCDIPKEFSNICLRFPQLQTLALSADFIRSIQEDLHGHSEIKSQLKSLTIELYPLRMNIIEQILSCVSSLSYLKLIGSQMSSDNHCDGHWWEELIQAKLPHLEKFEFFFSKQIDHKITSVDIESIITPFRTSFWSEKQWYVACDYHQGTRKLQIYSLPICKSSIVYESIPTKISCSNFTYDATYMVHNVFSLSVNSIPTTTVTSDKNLLSDYPIFQKVTTLTLLISNDFSNDSIDYLSKLVDFSHLDTLSLNFDLRDQSFENIISPIHALLDRLYNVNAIKIRYTRCRASFIKSLQTSCLMIPNQVKHLTIETEAIDEMKLILDLFEHLSSITFKSLIVFPDEFKKIILWLEEKERDFLYHQAHGYLSFWFGEKKIDH